MELRPRSRSNTPFGHVPVKGFEVGNHVLRSTRRTVRTVETVSTMDAKAAAAKRSSAKAVPTRIESRYGTSDYESEEGEAASSCSSTGMENFRNQLKEDLAAVNGNGEVSALKIYKEAGEYWNKYPKTDYTYSRHSKDRVELAPGVVVMPNMSRRSLHTGCFPPPVSETTILTTKQTNTDESFYGSFVRRLASTNNNEETSNDTNGGAAESFHLHRNNFDTDRRRIRTVITSDGFFKKIFYFLLRVYCLVVSPMVLVNSGVQGFFLGVARALHRVASRVFLWENWVLRKNVSAERKLYGILGLCLLPLLLFGGLCLLYGILVGLNTWMSPVTPTISKDDVRMDKITPPVTHNLDEERIVRVIEEMGYSKTPPSGDVRSKSEFEVELISELRKQISEIRDELNRKDESWKSEFLRTKEENARLVSEIRKYTNSYSVRNQDETLRRLHTVFLAKEELEEKIRNLTMNLKSDFNQAIENNFNLIMNRVKETIRIDSSLSDNNNNNNKNKYDSIDEKRIKKIISEALEIYDADKTGLVDYAMESAGGQILSTRCTESYQIKTAVVSVLGIPIWYPTNTPRAAITPGSRPGDCWAFQNFPGFLLIKLSAPVKISGFSLEHLNKKLSPDGKINSAPRDFEVFGLGSEEDPNPVLLGSYKYSREGDSLQFFPVENKGIDDSFDLVELRVLSNHGNPNYTCLYRFRVHGELVEGDT